MYRPGDVLDFVLAHVLKAHLEALVDLLAHGRRDQDAAGFGQRFEARGDIDPIAVERAVLVQHVAEIDADAQLHAAVIGKLGIARTNPLLDLRRRRHRFDRAREFRQQRIARRIDDTPGMRLDALAHDFTVVGERA